MTATEPNVPPVAPDSFQHRLSRSALELFFADASRFFEEGEPNGQVIDKSDLTEFNSIRPNKSEMDEFFAGVTSRVDEQRRRDRHEATGFNVFHLIEPDENKLSDILAGLLDPQGAHGQGDTFLRLLLQQLNFEVKDHAITAEATVQREAPTHGIEKYRRRMDVLVEAGFLVAIENKVDSLEQPDQVKDYIEHLHYCTRNNDRPNALIYLTPNGRAPDSLDLVSLKKHKECRRLHCWSYQRELRGWLEQCGKQCEAEKIRHFLSDFIAYIDSDLNREPINQNTEESNDG